jgi:putative restriction endonuclease
VDISAYWLKQIATLKVDKARGDPAPHKRLLLLVVIDLVEDGELKQEMLPLTGELAFRFCTYWTAVAHRRNQPPDVRMPFHHLKSGGFWAALDREGKLSPDKKLTCFAKLDSSFLNCLNDEGFRDRARRLIIGQGFQPEEQITLAALLDISVPTEAQVLRETAAVDRAAAVEQGREARFRLTVVPAYDYTCALTGLRLVTLKSQGIVDAAHIHQFNDSRNNDPRNGIALSKNAHWLFDRGLWSLTDEYRVCVACSEFSESGSDALLLKAREGERIRLPSNPRLWPNLVHIAWHRSNRFLGR